MFVLSISPEAALRLSSLLGFVMIALAPIFFNAHNVFKQEDGRARSILRWFVCLGLGMLPGLVIIILIYLSPNSNTLVPQGSLLLMALALLTVMGAIIGTASGILVGLTTRVRVLPFSTASAAIVSLLAALAWVLYIQYFDPRIGRPFFILGWDVFAVFFCVLVAIIGFIFGGFWPRLNSSKVATCEQRILPNKRLRRLLGYHRSSMSMGIDESASVLRAESKLPGLFPSVSIVLHAILMGLYWGALTAIVAMTYIVVSTVELSLYYGTNPSDNNTLTGFIVGSFFFGLALGGIPGLIMGALTHAMSNLISRAKPQGLAAVGGILLFIGVILQLPSHL